MVSGIGPRTNARSHVFKNSTFAAVGGSRSGLNPVGTPFLSGQMRAAQGAHQDFKPAILIENDLGRALPRQHRHQKTNQHGLTRAGRAANERMAGVLATAAVRIARVAGVEREVVRRAGAGDEERQRVAPVIAGRTAAREVVKGGLGAEVARGDRRFPRPEGKGPGSCAQKAASSARSSRAVVMPVSASIARARAISSLSAFNRILVGRRRISCSASAGEHLQA